MTPQRFQSLKHREYDNPMRGITLERAVYLRESYNTGNLADLMWAYMAPVTGLESANPDYTALIERRVTPLREMDWGIKQPSDVPDEQKLLAAEQAEAARALVDGIGNLYAALEHLAMASFRGYAHCEIIPGAGGTVAELAIIPQFCVVRDGMSDRWRYNPTASPVSYAALPPEYEIDPAKFVIRECARPLGGIALTLHVSAALCGADWEQFLGIYSVPGGIVTLPPNVPKEKEAAYLTAAEEISVGGHGALPHGSEYRPNAAPTGNAPFRERLDYLTEKLILAGTGGKLTMLTESGSGTLAGGAHSDTFASLARAEAARISAVIQEQLVEHYLKKKFPGAPVLAWFALAAEETPDTAGMIAEIKGLADAGYTVDPAQVAERTSWQPAGGVPVAGNAAVPPPQYDPRSVAFPNRAPRTKKRKPPRPVPFSAAELPPDKDIAKFVQRILDAPDDSLKMYIDRALVTLPSPEADPQAVDAWETALAENLLEGLIS